jgi:hypothetical protein
VLAKSPYSIKIPTGATKFRRIMNKTVENQLNVTQNLITEYVKKVQTDFNRLSEDKSKHGCWQYMSLVKMQDDLTALNRRIEQYLILELVAIDLRGSVSQSVEEVGSNPA